MLTVDNRIEDYAVEKKTTRRVALGAGPVTKRKGLRIGAKRSRKEAQAPLNAANSTTRKQSCDESHSGCDAGFSATERSTPEADLAPIPSSEGRLFTILEDGDSGDDEWVDTDNEESFGVVRRRSDTVELDGEYVIL